MHLILQGQLASPADIRQESCTPLDRSLDHHRAYSNKYRPLVFTSTGNSEQPLTPLECLSTVRGSQGEILRTCKCHTEKLCGPSETQYSLPYFYPMHLSLFSYFLFLHSLYKYTCLQLVWRCYAEKGSAAQQTQTLKQMWCQVKICGKIKFVVLPIIQSKFMSTLS